MSEKDSVKLIEVFNTWQGEGPDSGRSMLILRFKTCNLKCPWCDTRVKMRITPEAEYPLEQLQDILNEQKSGILITGGEPTVERHYDDTVKLLTKLHYPIANVESNGYQLKKLIDYIPPGRPIKFIYSPKIFSRLDLTNAVVETKDLMKDPRVFMKVVYEPDEWIETFLKRMSVEGGFHSRVYLMPEGVTRAELIKNSERVFDAAEKYKFNFSSRDHIIYGFV